jgi:hypothetical protein
MRGPHVVIAATDRSQSLPGRRGVQVQFSDIGTIVHAPGVTASLATSYAPFPVPPPPNAIGYLALINIGANTSAAGTLAVHLHSAIGNTQVNQAIGSTKQNMDSNGTANASQSMAPIVNGQALYEFFVTGTVNADVDIYLVGWVLA